MENAKSEYAARRQAALTAIQPGVLLLFAAPALIRNNDVEHDYRQDSDLYYLTGFEEPESVLLLSNFAEPSATLFVRPRDLEREVWDGPRLGVEGAQAELGVDAAYDIAELRKRLPELLENAPRLFYRLGREPKRDQLVLEALERVRARAKLGVSCPSSIVDPGTVLHEMRLFKSPAEVGLMRKAVAITGEAHVEAMARSKPGMYEYEVDGLLSGVFRRHGSQRCAYGSIVGSGNNATVLHYRRNDRQLQDGELLLIDAGCEYGYYASDITRTFPVGGSFSKPQAAIYDLVLEAQAESLRAVKPGATLEEIHNASVRVIARGLVELGVVQGPVEPAIAEGRYKPYYMHRTSHYLGMDVHDVGSYFIQGKPRPLEPGMVITVEPGIYISERAEDVAAEYRGIGVRIEDDVLVTAAGNDVLSIEIPKRREDVEQACRG